MTRGLFRYEYCASRYRDVLYEDEMDVRPSHIHNGNSSLQWCHNGRDGISNHQPHHCLLNRLFRRRSKKTSKLRVTGLCEGNSPVTGEFPAQMACNMENVTIWWRHHDIGETVTSNYDTPHIPIPIMKFRSNFKYDTCWYFISYQPNYMCTVLSSANFHSHWIRSL